MDKNNLITFVVANSLLLILLSLNILVIIFLKNKIQQVWKLLNELITKTQVISRDIDEDLTSIDQKSYNIKKIIEKILNDLRLIHNINIKIDNPPIQDENKNKEVNNITNDKCMFIERNKKFPEKSFKNDISNKVINNVNKIVDKFKKQENKECKEVEEITMEMHSMKELNNSLENKDIN